jgi:protein-export membrane protein, SecD/SecF family
MNKTMSKSKSAIVLVLTVMLIGVMIFTSAVGWGATGSGAAKNIKLGLDLAGGVSITYQSVEENPTAEAMSDTIYKLQQRVAQYSEEAVVYQEGHNRINIEIPGVSNADEILTELGKPGSLQFQDSAGNIVLDGTDVATATGGAVQDQNGGRQYVVSLELTAEGATKFAEATKANLGQQIAIVYDNRVISSPTVQSEITGGQAEITGMASVEEAQELAATIRIGSLSLELEEVRSNVVGAQLGQEAIRTSLIAGGIGVAFVIIFMLVIYGMPGFVAVMALLLYTSLQLVTLNVFDLTVTLPGIAGIVLSIGMAVDANVIIYARIREELADGSSVKMAISRGFDKALTAIVDGNVSTMIAAAVLWFLGSGPVKGFAMTLALGIVLSVFSEVVVSRILMNAFYGVGFKDVKFYGKQKERKTIDFVGKKKIVFMVAIALLLVGPISMAAHSAISGSPLNLSLEFMGGTATTVDFNEDMTIEEIDEKVKPVITEITGDADINTQKVLGGNQVIIKTRTLTQEEREQFVTAMEEIFQVAESEISAESISSTVSNEMRRDAILAVVVATIAMLLYIWFRFKDIRFATSGVIALIFDVMMVLATYALVRVSVGSTFIACMLTILGYSINATIVIFDRIRENSRRMSKASTAELVNASITQTLTRSIYTNLMALSTVAILFVIGVPAIREFALPIMAGIIFGTFSSVCITGPLWYIMKVKQAKTK